MMDYRKLGFRCGLECHQQLEGKKLFAESPTLNSGAEPTLSVQRRLRPVVGETGEIDAAAAAEAVKNRSFTYKGDSADVDLVDLDEQPPRFLNHEALKTALQVAKLLHMEIVDEIQVMRKAVVDGSNVSGFQRTALVAMDGFMETSQGKVAIPTLCLEEEAAQKAESSDSSVTYRLDRLGIPLLEIATAPELVDPEHAKEAAEHIGMVLRSTGRVKRGIGTIRQDVNVSIRGGARTEIKGFQELRSIPKVIAFEIERQLSAIKKGEKIEPSVRKAEPDMTTSFLRPMPGAARLYPETDHPPVAVTWEMLASLGKVELLSEKVLRLESEYGLSPQLAKEVLEIPAFAWYVKRFSRVEPPFIAAVLIEIPKEMKSRLKLDASKLRDEHFEEVLSYLDAGKIQKGAVIELLSDAALGNNMDISRYAAASSEMLEKEIDAAIASQPGLTIGAYMGIIMGKFKGKAEGKVVMEMLRKKV
ncbi:TPA: Glu-tRNA(Gln) amidotransferase subunit GatE [Candidatus Woesearchaeota archaeon]|nr:Glu-tRNA(Gln) amidotransferase subunit GatE [Candidatus Woesearchaeota archaeon]HII69155.1 Glu-tRNA(Gln) amidotransferase subunit GatE [Candidatus Woesearchaeota archaeon]